jgi:hypothetical protein
LFRPNGNPTTENLVGLIGVLQAEAGSISKCARLSMRFNGTIG